MSDQPDKLDLTSHDAHVRDGRTNADLLYEILLKSGIPKANAAPIFRAAGVTSFKTV